MSVSCRVKREGRCGANCASVLLCLIVGLAALLLTPTESAAHPLLASSAGNQVMSSGAIAETGVNEDPSGLGLRASLAALGGGCALAGLEVPKQVVSPRVTAAGDRLLPARTKPAQDIALTPPCPPPTQKLRVTIH